MPESRTFKAAILSSGQFLVTLTNLICAAILSRLFTKTDYAAYRQTILSYKFVAPLLTLGLPLALYYFLPRDRDKGRSILTGNLLLLFSMGCLFAIAMWCGGNKFLANKFDNSALRRLLLIYSPYGLLALPVAAISSCLVSCNRIKTLAIFNIANRIAVFLCVIGLVLVWRTPAAAISGMVIAALLVFFPALLLMYRATEGDYWHLDKTNIWAQMKYSIPLGVAAMIGTISLNLDKIIVSSMCTPEEFAVYANGAIEIPLISVITGSVMSVLLPEFSAMYQQEKYTEIKTLWHRAIIKCALLIFPIMVFLFVMAPEVIRILFSVKYAESVHPFRVYLLALPIRITHYGAIFMSAGRNKLLIYRSAVTLVLDLFLSIILVKALGSIGAAIATVSISYLFVVPYNIFYISKMLKIDLKNTMPINTLWKVAFLSIAAGVVFLLVPTIRQFGDILTLAVIWIFYSIAVLLLFDRFELIKIRDFICLIRSKLGL